MSTPEERTRRETRSSSLLTLKELLTPNELSSLSNDSKILYKALEKSITSHIKNLTDHYDALFADKEAQIQCLSTKIDKLEEVNANLSEKLTKLEYELDETAQYERRDTLILSGDAIPVEQGQEDPTQVIVDSLKSHLKIQLTQHDISVAHRLGKKKDGMSRPIIVKFISRSKKSQIVSARIARSKQVGVDAPVIHVNESLTPTRRNIFYQIRQLRKKHTSLFKTIYTQDGKIIVKLTATEDRKYTICNQKQLSDFLDVSPLLKDTYNSLFK